MPGKRRAAAPTGAIMTRERVDELRAAGHNVEIGWEPNDMQIRSMKRVEFEVFCGGGKGGGKSDLGRFWMVRGNPDQPNYDKKNQPILVNQSYIHHPQFLGAVIRQNEKDLAEWVDKARPYYEGVLGGTFTRNPAEFRWPSGARVFLGHAQDSNAWTKYQGQNIVRFLIEEAGLIPTLATFDEIRSCCRSVYPDMRPQILLTANPGGPGQGWIFDRYIEPKDRKGRPVMHPTDKDAEGNPRPILDSDKGGLTITEKVAHPFEPKKVIETTRVWMYSDIRDNPHLMKDTNYLATLATAGDKLTRAYLFADWKALRGTYFDIFNPQTHTYDPMTRPIASWWKSTASLDWGFKHESAAYWHKQDLDTKQHMIYKEFVTSGTDPVELGAALAHASMDELRVQGSIVFYVSHDLYHERIGEFTWVELIQRGAQKILGEGTCSIPDLVIARVKEAYMREGKEWDDSIADRILSKPITGIAFRRAPKARAVGFMYLRAMMRLEPLVTITDEQPDMEVALKLASEGSMENYVAYLRSFQREKEILPQMLISHACPRLIEAIPKAIHSDTDPNSIDETHFLGMDSIDSCLAAGTLVALERGNVPIEDVLAGDMALTRDGHRKVLWAGMTNPSASVVHLSGTNGKELIGTGNHPIWVEGKGFSPLDTVRYHDTLLACPNALNSGESNTIVTPILRGVTSESISGDQTITGSGSGTPSIAQFGNRSTVPSLKNTTSITLTATHSTTISPTLNALPQRSIEVGTRGPSKTYVPLPPWADLSPRRGTLQQKVASGIARIVKLAGKKEKSWLRSASSAQGSSPTSTGEEIDSVPTPARLGGDSRQASTTRNDPASHAEPNSKSTDTSIPRLVPCRVKTLHVLHAKRPVYNLQVEGSEEYLANGFLVHNCRYLIAGIRDEKPTPMSDELRRQQMMEAVLQRNPDITTMQKVMLSRTIEDQMQRESAGEGGFNLGRAARASRRRIMDVVAG